MKIYDIAKCLTGNVLGIGIDYKMEKILSENKLILTCNLLNSDTNGTSKKGKRKKLKKIQIKKIRKIFKRKKVDFILCNINEIKKYLKTFIKDSIYINKNLLYIYNINDNELKEDLINKYSRYNTKIEEIKDGENIILKIDNTLAKTNKIKDTIYLILDTIVNILNLISDLLLN